MNVPQTCTHSGLRFRGLLTALEPAAAERLRGDATFFGLGGGGFGSKMVGWPSTIGCGSSSSSSRIGCGSGDRQGGRIKLRAQLHNQAALFIGFAAHHGLVLRIIQQLGEPLEADTSAD